MGFLRKVGRKIKKGIKKLFSSKFGKILGGVGLSLMFLGGANALFGKTQWFKNLNTSFQRINPFADSTLNGAIEKLDNAKFGDLNFGEKISKVGVEIGKGFKTAGESIGEKIKKPFTGDFEIGETVADVTEAGLKQTVLSELEGEQIDEGGFGRIPDVGSFEPSYVQSLNTNMPNLQINNMQQANQSLFYGTLSPQFLLQQEQYYS
tara:strand:- start:39 stop:656 length:618 start_codon:yes stop_codon:yes gene_type:complete